MNNETTNTTSQVRGLVQAALFAALIILMAMVPFLGYIPLGFTRATIIHIPVILGALVLGPKKGAFLGLIFGLTSLINNTMNPTVTSFVFSPFLFTGRNSGGICKYFNLFCAENLTGVVPYYVYHGVRKVTTKWKASQNTALFVAGISGALTNTLLVMNMIYFFFKDDYAQVNQVSVDAVYGFIMTIIGINGVPEAIVAAILTMVIGRILLKLKERLH